MNLTVSTRKLPGDVQAMLSNLPAILAGRVSDPWDIAKAVKLRVGVKVLSIIQQNFLELSRGGKGMDGSTWKPLSKAYLAYQRRFGKNEKSKLKTAAGLDKRHKYAPGGRDGLLTKDQIDRWWEVYGKRKGWMLARGLDLAEAKSAAAAMAWEQIKREGAKTKLEVFGSRKVEILRDTGVTFASLTPGIADRPSGAPNQVFRVTDAAVIVGTNAPHAASHHYGTKTLPQRAFWPEPDRWPAAKWAAVIEVAQNAVMDAVRKGLAA